MKNAKELDDLLNYNFIVHKPSSIAALTKHEP